MKEIKFSYDTKVKIENINDLERASHLKSFIGQTGEIISWIRMDSETTKYKVIFDQENEQHYFFEDELIEVK